MNLYTDLPSPDDFDFPKYKHFTFSKCKDDRGEASHHCGAVFTTKSGQRVYCDCDCHLVESND